MESRWGTASSLVKSKNGREKKEKGQAEPPWKILPVLQTSIPFSMLPHRQSLNIPWVSKCLILGPFLSPVTFRRKVGFEEEDKSQTSRALTPLCQPQGSQENFPLKSHRLTFASFLPHPTSHMALTDSREWIPSPPHIQVPITFLPFPPFISKVVLLQAEEDRSRCHWMAG